MEALVAMEALLPTVVRSEMAAPHMLLTPISTDTKPAMKEVAELVLSLEWATVVLEVVSSG